MKDDLGIVGKWFHSVSDGKISWQGKVIGRDGDFVLLQLHSYIDGMPSVQRLVFIDSMVEWYFYDTDEEMATYYKIHAHQGKKSATRGTEE